MKLQLKCDKCGAIGGPDAILTGYDGNDLCGTCMLRGEIESLKDTLAEKTKWLEDTHLKQLRSIEAQIKELEARANGAIFA